MTIRNYVARQIWSQITAKHRKVLQDLLDIRKDLGCACMDSDLALLALPEISKSDLHDFMKTINSPNAELQSTVKDLEVMYIWREDERVKLFAD